MEKNSGHLIAKDTCRDHSVFHCSISAPSTWRKEKEKENPYKWLIPLSKNLCAIHWSNEFCRTLALSSTPTEKKNEKMDFVQLYWILIKNCCTSCLFVGFHGRRNVSGKHTRVRGYCQFLRTFTRTEYEKVIKAKPSAERERIWTDLLIPTGQKNHVKHYHLTHFTWQRQLICEKTRIETDWKKKNTWFLYRFIQSDSKKQTLITQPTKHETCCYAIQKHPPSYHKWQSKLWITMKLLELKQGTQDLWMTLY